MQIQLSKKILDMMPYGTKIDDKTVEDPGLIWYCGHLASANAYGDEDLLILSQEKTHFPLIAWPVQWFEVTLMLTNDIPEMLRQTLATLGVEKDVIDNYLAYQGEVTFARNRNRSAGGLLSNARAQTQTTIDGFADGDLHLDIGAYSSWQTWYIVRDEKGRTLSEQNSQKLIIEDAYAKAGRKAPAFSVKKPPLIQEMEERIAKRQDALMEYLRKTCALSDK